MFCDNTDNILQNWIFKQKFTIFYFVVIKKYYSWELKNVTYIILFYIHNDTFNAFILLILCNHLIIPRTYFITLLYNTVGMSILTKMLI